MAPAWPSADAKAPFDRTTVDAATDGVYYVDAAREIVYWNTAAERLSGHLAADVVGRRCYDNLLRHVDDAGNELCFGGCPLAATIVDGQEREANVYLHHRSGYRQAVRVKALPVKDNAGSVIGAAEVFTDGGERTRTEERLRELERLALIDPLTGVGNRRFLEMTLTTRAEELRRYGWPFGILVIDLDKFKRINDRYGHDVGDQALKTVASTLTNCSRGTDAVGRWGGDEFMVVLANANETGLQVASERVRTLVERSRLDTPRGPVHVTVSIGGSLAGPGACGYEALVQAADRRMYCAKSRGRNCTSVEAA